MIAQTRGVHSIAPAAFAWPVAQWLEPAAHNGLVAGSSPAGPPMSSNIWRNVHFCGGPFRGPLHNLRCHYRQRAEIKPGCLHLAIASNYGSLDRLPGQAGSGGNLIFWPIPGTIIGATCQQAPGGGGQQRAKEHFRCLYASRREALWPDTS